MPKYTLCPHCGYQSMKPDVVCGPDVACGFCIPPEFRAETAREFAAKMLEDRGATSPECRQHHLEFVTGFSVTLADALIAALRKPPTGHDPYAVKS